MDEQIEIARAILRQADGYIDWDSNRNCPAWYLSRIYIEGRFTSEELRAIIEFEGKRG